MIEIKNDNHTEHLIVLVHGLGGGKETWTTGASDPDYKNKFVYNLLEEDIVKVHFNLNLFVYVTHVIQLTWLKRLLNIISNLLPNSKNSRLVKFNQHIEEYGNSLRSDLLGLHERYRSITFITHSMGGLVTKSALTNINDDVLLKKIKVFISLSVPHNGSKIANLAELLIDNPHVMDLKLMGRFTNNLNQAFAAVKYTPSIIYQYGQNDTVVPKASALLGGSVKPEYIVPTDNTHKSILFIDNRHTNRIFQRITNELWAIVREFWSMNFMVNDGWSIRQAISIIEQKSSLNFVFNGFTKSDLNMSLNSGSISFKMEIEGFNQIISLAKSEFPKFTLNVDVIRNNVIIKKRDE